MVVDARGDMTSGIFGDMMMTYFFTLAQWRWEWSIDGSVRDWAKVRSLVIPMWLKRKEVMSPRTIHAQTVPMPYLAVNVPVQPAAASTVIPLRRTSSSPRR